MSKNIKGFKILFAVLLLLLVGLFAGYLVIKDNVDKYNSKLRSDKKDEGLSITIAPRGGATDSWEKIMSDGRTITGTIFEMEVQNVGDCDISDWTQRINIKNDCYINNAWCGSFEIHQFVDGKENVQTIDLRAFTVDDITLDYVIEGPDLMISLHKGDYLVYIPSSGVYETPLTTLSREATIGFIMYYEGNTPSFYDTEANFYYDLALTQSNEFKVLIVLAIIWLVALIVSISLYIFSLYTRKELEKREKNLEESIGIFSEFVDAKDTYTNGHSKRVAYYGSKIAKALGYNDKEVRNVYYIGLMHDCGKCYIPDNILKKPGPLTPSEYATIKSHTTYGGELLKNFTSLENIKEGALYHHERFDGKGYPNGLSGKNIPEIGRILAIADAFDAMNSKRVYRSPLSKEVILKELENGKGTQFDPDILEVFIKLLEKGEITFSQEK